MAQYLTREGERQNPLYLCDPRKNASCRGMVCFYGPGPWHWCCLTGDPACALEGPEGEPLAMADEWPTIHDKQEPGGSCYPVDEEK